jgi:hypothetical protein
MAQGQIKWGALNYGISSYKCINGEEYLVAEKWFLRSGYGSKIHISFNLRILTL